MVEKEIRRDSYVEKLLARRMNGFVKVITGIRRCGKSYLLNRLYRDRLLAEGVRPDHIISVDLDDKAFLPMRDPNRLDAYVRGRVKKGKTPYFVFVDEIQRSLKMPIPGIDLASLSPEDREDAFVTFYDTLNGWRSLGNVDVYVTGSNSKTLSSDIATNFRDRGQQIRVWPLSFAEYLAATGMTDKQEAFHRYLTWGGMPVATLTDDDGERAAYLKGLFAEVYLNDIRERLSLKDDLVISSVIDVLSSDIGSLTNPHRIADTMNSRGKIRPSDHTLKKYVDLLEDAFLFAHARRFEVKGRRYLDSPVKYYATDTGLRNARLNFRDTDLSHPMENAIYNELLRRGFSVDVGVVPISSRDENGRQSIRQHEIDFIVNRGSDRIYIQSALKMESEAKARQETASLRGTGDFFKKVVVTGGYGDPQADRDGIVHMGVIPFLLNPNSLSGL